MRGFWDGKNVKDSKRDPYTRNSNFESETWLKTRSLTPWPACKVVKRSPYGSVVNHWFRCIVKFSYVLFFHLYKPERFLDEWPNIFLAMPKAK
jgi:hypothetical protein